MLSRLSKLALMGAAVVAAPVAGAVMIQAAPVETPEAIPVSGEEQPVVVLARRLCERVKAIAPDSDSTRFEAELVYTLSQSGTDVKLQGEALRRMRDYCPLGGGMDLALTNANASIGRGGTAGTAALAMSLGQGGFDSGSAFSSPAVDLGGGSVNYAR